MANLSETLHINFYQNRSSIVEVMIKKFWCVFYASQCKFVQAEFFMSFLVFVSRDFELGRTSLTGGVDRHPRTGLIFITDLATLKMLID